MLSKVANYYAKRNYKGIYLIDSNNLLQALTNITIDNLWGIGRKNFLKLERLGISTALKLANSPRNLIRKTLTVIGSRIQDELKHINCLELEELEPKKNISSSRAFGTILIDIEPIKATILGTIS